MRTTCTWIGSLAFLLVLIAPPAPGGEDATPPEAQPGRRDASTPAFEKAVDLQRRGRWSPAKKAFERLIDRWPDSVHRGDAEARSGDNAYLGTTRIHVGGPSERRIDVTVMGDGFTIEPKDQKLQERWAKLCVDVLWNEPVYAEYRDYFNVYFVRLASLDEGVDPDLSESERRRIEERNRRRTRKRKTDFSTALDCKAAGPQGQVRADPALVYRWLGIAAKAEPGCADDRLVIAFARFGKLGMGGGGIANVGRPDKSITVHEFGHSFAGLADEYAVNPGSPGREIRQANAATTDDPREVPWSHFLEKGVKGVGVYEGGATSVKGVWRPARTCAMNSAGATAYCPVCRETAVLAVYARVNPVDEVSPDPAEEVLAAEKEDEVLSVLPMRPRKHALRVRWFVQPAEATTGSGWSPTAMRNEAADLVARQRRAMFGARRLEDRSAYDTPPAGVESRLGKVVRGRRGEPDRHVFPLGKLEAGDYRITVVVDDPTPWVLKDPTHLLEERVTWRVTVLPD